MMANARNTTTLNANSRPRKMLSWLAKRLDVQLRAGAQRAEKDSVSG